ncbi:hypothetical protein A4A49_08319 [Nicotiana attenuata]|uniref:Uncharacterized protein n=1 Tax=Nicotiana attenuata TaxID=49451 RepID=A0A314KV51_NICAT|nr:hypothetical protein A4A49_08319 [Nicotiana attenuata]
MLRVSLLQTQEDSSSTSMDEEEVLANFPQASHTTTDSPAAKLDEPVGADVDMPNGLEDVVAEPQAAVDEPRAYLQEQQAAY